MNKKKLFYLVFPTLLLISCRNESDVLMANSTTNVVKQFAAFSPTNGQKIDYALAFQKLSLRHDAIHSRNFSGVSSDNKKIITDEHIAFAIHSKPLVDKYGNTTIIYPRVSAGKVIGLVAASVNIDATKVRIINLEENRQNTIAYQHDVSIFQSRETKIHWAEGMPLLRKDVGLIEGHKMNHKLKKKCNHVL